MMVKNQGRRRAKKRRNYQRKKDTVEFDAFGKPKQDKQQNT